MDSDDPSLTQVLERLEDVRKGSTLVCFAYFTMRHWEGEKSSVSDTTSQRVSCDAASDKNEYSADHFNDIRMLLGV